MKKKITCNLSQSMHHLVDIQNHSVTTNNNKQNWGNVNCTTGMHSTQNNSK